MDILTASEMQEMDRETSQNFGLPGRVLMENAGRGIVQVLMETFPEALHGGVAVAAGRGNNGGDGFVAARYLSEYGIPVTVYLLSEASRLKGDANDNFNLLAPLNVTIRELPDMEAFSRFQNEMAGHAVWIDAILGTGLTSEVAGYFKSVIEFINGLNRPVLAVDIPSGVHSDTGAICGTCIHAAGTVTFAFPKIGHCIHPGAAVCGTLHVIDIGIPSHIAARVGPRQHLITTSAMKALWRPRPDDAHKGRTGHLLTIAGGTGKTGAAALCALSGLRSGAGLVTLAVPETLYPMAAAHAPEIMTAPVPDNGTALFSEAGLAPLMALLDGKRVIALGPGIGTDPRTRELMNRLITQCPIPMVIDADGINIIAENPEILLKRRADIILTPHPGEMARLVNTTPADIQSDRVGQARGFAEKYQVNLVLKGARTVIARPDGHVYINSTGNSGMASAGMGDVLTGVIAGFAAQGYEPDEAARLGVYLHGDAADAVAREKGPMGYIAGDVMTALPGAMARLTAAGTKAAARGILAARLFS
jgi:ADP-dependent NAD(P)H-hydrate dehydratase / NAD(P)H-hydrate epimerase